MFGQKVTHEINKTKKGIEQKLNPFKKEIQNYQLNEETALSTVSKVVNTFISCVIISKLSTFSVTRASASLPSALFKVVILAINTPIPELFIHFTSPRSITTFFIPSAIKLLI